MLNTIFAVIEAFFNIKIHESKRARIESMIRKINFTYDFILKIDLTNNKLSSVCALTSS